MQLPAVCGKQRLERTRAGSSQLSTASRTKLGNAAPTTIASCCVYAVICMQVVVKTAQQNSRRWSAIGPILACGDTNAAVDNLVEGLANKKLRVVRLGQPAKV